MSRFRLSIEIDNAAFFNEIGKADPAPELVRILRELADRLESGEDPSALLHIRDVNGNMVGQALTED
jgi:hypothetical protein